MTIQTLRDLNACPADRFRTLLGGVFEHSPWVADAVFPRRPFDGIPALHSAMVEAVRAAPESARLKLLRAHPDLAGKEARQDTLTEHSTNEQRGAGLDLLTPAEADTLLRGNAAYRLRFGFPFIICVRNRTRQEIFQALAIRLRNEPAAEFDTALQEVYEIARLRLEAGLV